MTGLTRTYLTFAIGDVKPVVFNVTSSTGSLPTIATCTLIDHGAAGTPVSGQTNQSMSVTGSTLVSPLITWNTVSIFILLVKVTFADGVIDNTVVAQITVFPLPT